MCHAVIEQGIIEYLRSLTGQSDLSRETDLQTAGVTDSLTMMDLLVFVETEFQLRLEFEDLTPAVFRTPATLSALIVSRLTETVQRHAA